MGLYETGRFAEVAGAELERAATPDHVAAIVEKMLADLEANPPAWENHTLERFLDALSRYLPSQRQAYVNTGRTYPEAAPWRLIAEALVAATGYE